MRLFGAVMFTFGTVSNSINLDHFELIINILGFFFFFFHKFILFQMAWLPIVIYVPALAFNQGQLYFS